MSIESLRKVQEALISTLGSLEVVLEEANRGHHKRGVIRMAKEALALLPGIIEEMEQLKSQLFDMRSRFCDAERLIAWIDDPKRKPAVHAFTEGNERQIAYRVEDALAKVARWEAEVTEEEVKNAGAVIARLMRFANCEVVAQAAIKAFQEGRRC